MATLFQIFRVLCDVSVMVIYQGSALRGGIWRLKLVLLYCFAVSSLTVGGFILKLAIDLSLHWNPQFYLDPIPFHLTFASSFFIGMQGNACNLRFKPQTSDAEAILMKKSWTSYFDKEPSDWLKVKLKLGLFVLKI